MKRFILYKLPEKTFVCECLAISPTFALIEFRKQTKMTMKELPPINEWKSCNGRIQKHPNGRYQFTSEYI